MEEALSLLSKPMQAFTLLKQPACFVPTPGERKGDACNGPVYLVTLMMCDLGIALYNLEYIAHFRYIINI